MTEPREIQWGRRAIQAGWITPAQLDEAARIQSDEVRAGNPQRPIGDILIERGWLTEARLRLLIADAGEGKTDRGTEPVQAETLRRAQPGPAVTVRQPGAIGAALPARFGRYEILAELGRGAMGVVYRARDPLLGRQVALKVMSGTHEEDRRRFRREAAAMAQLHHPNILPVYEVGEEAGQPYYTMELVEGDSLSRVIAQMERVPPRAALKIVRDAALALQHAHEQGIIHRDMKPGNILICRAAHPSLEDDAKESTVRLSSGVTSAFRVLVADFGLAHVVQSRSMLTQTGQILGTPSYMSPEQACGDVRRVGPASDIYSLGVVLYELLCGRRPFEDKEVWRVLSRVIHEDPEPLRQRAPGLHPDIETIVAKAMAKEPERRYATAREFAEDIERYLRGEPILARPATWAYRGWRWVYRRRRECAVGALVTLLAAAALGGTLWSRAARERRLREEEAAGLLKTASVYMARGEYRDAWRLLNDLIYRLPETSARIEAYWKMADLARAEAGGRPSLGEEPWLRRILDDDPTPLDAAKAHARLGRIYEFVDLVGRARHEFEAAVKTGALQGNEADEARIGMEWTEFLGRRVQSDIEGSVVGKGDLDGDGREELLVIDGAGTLSLVSLEGDRLVVRRREDTSAWTGPRVWSAYVTDLNNDGRREVLVRGGSMWIFDLSESPARLLWQSPHAEVALAADLDGDGSTELLAAHSQPSRDLVLYRFTRDWACRQSSLMDLKTTETTVRAMAMGDLDGDRRPEVVLACGPWTLYDVRVCRIEGESLRVLARRQVGVVAGLACLDMDGDGRDEIFAVKTNESPCPRLFESDPYLGPPGPRVFKLDGGQLRAVWEDTLGSAEAAGKRDCDGTLLSSKTRWGPVLWCLDTTEASIRFYFTGGQNRLSARWMSRLGGPGLPRPASADLDGDGRDEIVRSGSPIVVFGVGPVQPDAEGGQTAEAVDPLSLARHLRASGHPILAVDSYTAALGRGADPHQVNYEIALCWEVAGEPGRALDLLKRLVTGPLGERREFWEATLRCAEQVSDWPAALQAARKLGDRERERALERVLALAPVFVQDAADGLHPAWQVVEPMSVQARADPPGLVFSPMPREDGLALPVEWDGTDLRVRMLISMEDLQYTETLFMKLKSVTTEWWVAGSVSMSGGGGALSLVPSLWSWKGTDSGTSVPLDWDEMPPRVWLELASVSHLNRWELVIRDPKGRELSRTVNETPNPVRSGQYDLVLGSAPGRHGYASTSEWTLYRIEVHAQLGALRVLDEPGDNAARLLATGQHREAAEAYGARSDAAGILRRAWARAFAGQLDGARADLAAYRELVDGQPSGWTFEYEEYELSAWEGAVVRLFYHDEALCRRLVVEGDLMERERYAELLRRAAYQKFVDSGQTHWRRAIPYLRVASELAPGDAHAWYYLGICRYRLGDPAAAAAAFTRAWELLPELEERYPKQGGPAVFLAKLAAAGGDREAAERWIVRAREAGGNMDAVRHHAATTTLLGAARVRELIGD